MTAKQAKGRNAPDGSEYVTLTDGAGTLASLTLDTTDIEIGAVEIKNDSDDTRAKVGGGVSTNALRVVLSTNDPAVASLDIMDDWDETDRCKVNIISGQAGVAAGSGASSATTQRVIHATDDPLVTKATGPTIGAITSVNDTNVDGTILASNVNRKGASFFNDSTVVLYLACASTVSSATNYTVQIPAGAFYELTPTQGGVYTGVVKGIWASDASGAVRVTEWT